MIAPHQQEFKDTARAYEGCFHGTGTGKTRTALYSVKEHQRILVIAPKTSVQKGQWIDEAVGLHMKNLPTVISKETFRRDHKILPYYDAVIWDEAHHVFGVMPNTRQRNKVKIPKASQMFESLVWYLKAHQPKRLVLATATPNKTPMAIWAAAYLLGHRWDFYAFRDNFYIRLPMQYEVYAPNRDARAMEELAAKTREIGQVLRLADIRDVPEQTFMTETFDLTEEQKKVIKTLPGRFADAGSLRVKTHQVENGVLYEDVFNKKTHKVSRKTEFYTCPKVEYIVERSDEFEKMVIFANYTAQVEMIAEALLKSGKENVYTLTGATKDRKTLIDTCEAKNSAYLIVQGSVSSEWEFKSCGVMIFASLTNKSLDYIQAQGRIQRYDAIKKNLYIHLITGKGVDARWHKTIMSGRDFNEALYEEKGS